MESHAVTMDRIPPDRHETRENSTLIALVLAGVLSLIAFAVFAWIKAAALGLV
jgi:hypothetical protein